MIQHLAGPEGVALHADPWLYIDEIEHRVANEYALAVASISRLAARSADAGVKAALGDTAQRLRDYADAHRALQAPLHAGPADLAAYLRRLSDAIVRASLAERGITFTLIEQSIDLDASRCWRVGLIVSELITNAVRHGFAGGPGAITLEMARGPGLVHCRISDDGRPASGAPPGKGALLVDSLAGELGGFIDRRFGEGGTTVVLSFPEDGSDLHDACRMRSAAAPPTSEAVE
jgi:two-component sensor histidine kinase